MGTLLTIGSRPAVARTIDLADLGFDTGQTLRAQAASKEVFFPVPAGADGARLHVKMRFSPALDTQSALTIELDGEPVATLLRRNSLTHDVTVDVPQRLLDRQFVRVGFSGDLAVNRDPCTDNARPSVWARLAPETAMDFSTTGSPAHSVGAVWQDLLSRAVVAIPRQPSTAETAAALRIMAALYRRGTTPVLQRMQSRVPARLPDIVIGDVPWSLNGMRFGGSHALTVLQREARSPRSRPETAIWLREASAVTDLLAAHSDLLRAQRGVYSADRRSGSDRGDLRRRSIDRLTFRELGHPTTTQIFSARDAFTVGLSMTDVPSGFVPSTLVLNGRGPELGENGAMMVNVFVNGQYAESHRYDSNVVVRDERVPISPTTLGRNNTFKVALQRLSLTPACKRGMTSTFQLHGGSYVKLAQGEYNPAAIRDWVVHRDQRLRVVVPQQGKLVARLLPTLARLLADAVRPGTPVTVAHERGSDAGGPFIHVAQEADADYAKIPVAADRGHVEIATGNGDTLRFQPQRRYTLVQLVRRGDAWGVWMVPGSDVALPRTGGFGSGDVALFDGGRPPISIDTRKPKITVTYPEDHGLSTFLRRHRTPLFVGGWVLLTVAVAAAVIRMRRRWGSEA